MTRGLHRGALAIALATILALTGSTALVGCSQRDASARTAARRPVPPIDREVPTQLETATFAMG